MSYFRDSHHKLSNSSSSSGSLDREAKRRSLIQRKSKDKNEDAEESPVTPDSTTEPPRPAHDLQEGEDVFYCTEEGQNMLGTIGQVTQFRCQILFGDGTQQWAPFQRVKKLSCSFNEEGPSPPSRSTDESTSRTTTRDQLKTEVVCTVCKNVKKMSSKKARLFTTLPFKCNRCIGTKTESNPPSLNITNNNHHHTPSATLQKKASLSRQLIKRLSTSDSPCPPKNQQLKSPTTPSSNSLNHLAMNLQTGDISIRPIHNINSSPSSSTSQYLPTQQTTSSIPQHQPSPMLKTSVPHHHRPASASVNSPPVTSRGASTVTLQNSNHMTPQGRIGQGTGAMSIQMSNSAKNTRTNLCFHCSKRTCLYDRVHCNMCERYCHLLCLPSLTPPPLEGDKFWDVMCSACGTQNGSEKGGSKVFSVRRSIGSWSDVVHLIINCLKVTNMGQQYFDFDNQIMVFFDNNIDKLHLPRQYKVVPREERKTHLLDALTKSRFRFSKHKTSEMKKTGSSWALISDHSSSPTPSCSKPTSDYQDATPNTTTTTTSNKNGNIHVATTDKDIAKSRNMNQLRSPANNNTNTNNNNKNLQGLPTRFTDIDASPRPSYLNLNQSPSQSSNSDQSTVAVGFHREKVDKSPHSTLSVKFKNASYSSHNSSISTSPTLSSPSHNNKSASASPRITTTTSTIPNINNSPTMNINNNVATSFPRVLSKEVLLRNPITTNIVLAPTKATMQSQAIQGKGPLEVKKDKPLYRTSKITNTPKKVGRPRKRENADKFKTKPSAKSSLSDTSVNVHRQRLRIRLPMKRPGDKQKDSSDATVATDSPKKKQTCSTPSSTSSSSNVVKTGLISLSLASSPMQQEQQNLTPLASSSSPSKEIRSRKRAFVSDILNSSQNQNCIAPGIQSVDGTLKSNVGVMGKTTNQQLNGMSKAITLGGSKSNKHGQNYNANKNRKIFSNQMSHNNSNIVSLMENENQLDGNNEDLSTFRSNLVDACLFGGLKTQCLPNVPKSKTEMEKKIGEYLTAEADDGCRSSSPSHNEIGYDGGGGGSSSVKRLFCNWPSRHNYPPRNYDGCGHNSNNMHFGTDKLVDDGGDTNFLKQKTNIGKKSKRNLEDLDSYDIIAMRVGEDGIVRYEVVWLDEVAFTPSEEEDMDLNIKDDVHTHRDEGQSRQMEIEDLKTSLEVDNETIMNGNTVGKEVDKGFAGIELQDSSKCADISIKKENEAASEAAAAVAKKNGHRKLSVSLQQVEQKTSKRDPVFIDLTDSP